MSGLAWAAVGVAAALAALIAYDLLQRRHAILRNFPIVGHFRFLFELVGPELRQYIVTSNDEERPFSRDQRRWIYASSKREDNRFGFGTDNDLERQDGYLVISPSAFPPPGPAPDPSLGVPVAKVLGAARGRRHAFRPGSIVNVSGMSFGALGAHAVEAHNRGAALAGALHNTGEGGLSPHHLHGADVVLQVGTAYHGCRDPRGRFSLERLVEACDSGNVRAVEVKLSQGAKPGRGGMLPAAKVTREIAAARGVRAGEDCVSPPYHTEFADEDGLLDFVERIADATGLPVGIKSAVGDLRFWRRLADLMARGDRGVDFVTIDGGEGGTGAAPLAWADHVALPFKIGFSRVHAAFSERRVAGDVVWLGSGRLGMPEQALFAFALGVDAINVGREAMMAAGCIQAQRCHTGRCPSGVATQSRWLQRGLDPAVKAVRVATYIDVLRAETLGLARTAGAWHPGAVDAASLELLDGRFGARTVAAAFGYAPGWGIPAPSALDELRREWPAPGGGEGRGGGAPSATGAGVPL